MSRFWDITVCLLCQVNKISALTLFPKSAYSTIVLALEVTRYDGESVFSYLKVILFQMNMYMTDTATNMTVWQFLVITYKQITLIILARRTSLIKWDRAFYIDLKVSSDEGQTNWLYTSTLHSMDWDVRNLLRAMKFTYVFCAFNFPSDWNRGFYRTSFI